MHRIAEVALTLTMAVHESR